jgi:hypothetical protein
LKATSRLGMKDALCITLSWITDSKIKTYSIEENKFALNSAWSEDLLCKLTFMLKSIEFEMYPLKFASKQKADITVDWEIDRQEYDESAADHIEMTPFSK